MMTMLKGNTAAGKSQRLNSEERPLDRKTLKGGDGEVRGAHLLHTCLHIILVGVCVCVTNHVADPKHTGSSSHQYQSPAELNTPISRDTNMPLKPW